MRQENLQSPQCADSETPQQYALVCLKSSPIPIPIFAATLTSPGHNDTCGETYQIASQREQPVRPNNAPKINRTKQWDGNTDE